jgi:hypothetical protein
VYRRADLTFGIKSGDQSRLGSLLVSPGWRTTPA